jgi:hypothetical protein
MRGMMPCTAIQKARQSGPQMTQMAQIEAPNRVLIAPNVIAKRLARRLSSASSASSADRSALGVFRVPSAEPPARVHLSSTQSALTLSG